MTEKRTNYPGVYKESQTGNYTYRFRYGKSRLTGKPIQIHKRGFLTAKAADVARTLAKTEMGKMQNQNIRRMTFANFTNDIFLPDYYSRVNQRLVTIKVTFLENLSDGLEINKYKILLFLKFRTIRDIYYKNIVKMAHRKSLVFSIDY